MRGILTLVLLTCLVTAGCVEQGADLVASSGGCFDASGSQSFPDVFQYAGGVACKTTTEVYEWANPNVQGFVQWTGATSAGSLEIRILDAIGRVVFEGDAEALAVEGEQRTTAYGFPTYPTGSWTVELRFQDFTGMMGLQVTSTA